MSGESEAANREVERSRVSQRVKWYVNACAWRIAQCLSTTSKPGPYADIFPGRVEIFRLLRGRAVKNYSEVGQTSKKCQKTLKTGKS